MNLTAATPDELRAELARLRGDNIVPLPGCFFAWLPLGPASVKVEYEPIGRNVAIQHVLINGTWCDAEDVIPPETLEAWRELLREDIGDGKDHDRDYDNWRDRQMEQPK